MARFNAASQENRTIPWGDVRPRPHRYASASVVVQGTRRCRTNGVVLVVSHRVALSHLGDICDRLAFVKTPLIGYVHVRPPRGLGIRTPWGRVTRQLRRSLVPRA